MKKVYVQPDMRSRKFELEDIITASGATPPETRTAEIDLTSAQWNTDVTFDDSFFDN